MKQIHLNLRAWLVSLAALLAALPACADVTLDKLEFTEVAGGYSVSAKSPSYLLEGALVIPTRMAASRWWKSEIMPSILAPA